MIKKNQPLSRWLAPPIGAVIGIGFGLKLVDQPKGQGPPNMDPTTAGLIGALMGLGAGVVILLVDPPWTGAEPARDGVETFDHGLPRSDFMGRIATVLALLLFLAPFVGTGLSLIAVWANWRRSDWSRRGAKIALALSIPMTLLTVLALMTKK